MEEDHGLYIVIANCEDALALWPVSQAVPAGWRTLVGSTSRELCASFLQQLETERRPNVIRRLLERQIVHP